MTNGAHASPTDGGRAASPTVVGRAASPTDVMAVMPQEGSRRTYTFAFAWRTEASGETLPWDQDCSKRRSPAFYCECALDLVRTRAAEDANCRFIAHMHGRLGADERAAIEGGCRTAFEHGRGRAPTSEDLRFVYCDESRHCMWPQVARVAPLFDLADDEATVVLCDVHDPLLAQREAAAALESALDAEGRGLALTFWLSSGRLVDSFPLGLADGQTVAPPPLLSVLRTPAMCAADEHWSLDAGLACSKPSFRRALRALVGGEGFSRHLEAAERLYEYESSSGTDEALLSLYVLALRTTRDELPNDALGRLCRQHTTLMSHTLRARTDAPPPHAWPDAMSPPTYDTQPTRSHAFAFDAEVPRRLKLRKLEWEPERPVPNKKRARRLDM